MKKILISACLVGDKTKYDGKSNYTPLIDKLLEKYELVPFCPEVEGGLSIPRKKSEIKDGNVINEEGKDVSKYFLKGAELAYNICIYLGIEVAILKDRSPSCGSKEIYDGSFSNRLIKGKGITASFLEKKKIRVISEEEIESFLEEDKKQEFVEEINKTPHEN